jgi:hypothetical protein
MSEAEEELMRPSFIVAQGSMVVELPNSRAAAPMTWVLLEKPGGENSDLAGEASSPKLQEGPENKYAVGDLDGRSSVFFVVCRCCALNSMLSSA